MAEQQKSTRKLKAILSADVKGYSRLMSDDESYTIKVLKEYKQIMSAVISQHSGRVVDAPGDNLLAEFSSIVHAVQSAVEVQKILTQKNAGVSQDKKLEFRIGVNIGDVVQDGARLYGEGINIAARIEGLADPGGICISRGAYDHIKNKLDFGYEYIGEHSVKNIKDPVRVYKVLVAQKKSGKTIGGQPKPAIQTGIWPILMGAAAGLILVGYQVFYTAVLPEFKPASTEKTAYHLPDTPSIAVLPFENMSGDPSQEYFSDGLTEEIITAFSKVPELFVIARNSTFTYKGRSADVQEIAEELGVTYILEGSVRKDKEKVRIAAQLIDASTGHHLWADRYDRNLSDIFAVQDEITMKILGAMEIQLTEGEQSVLWKKGTNHLDVYLKFLQGLYIVRDVNPESNLKARKIFEDILRTEPDYAHAYRIIGWTHWVDIWLGIATSREESLKKAVEFAKKSLSIDASQGGAYVLLGHINILEKKFDTGIPLLQKAVALEPSGADYHMYLGMGLCFAGRPQDALPILEKAIKLNPFAPANYFQSMGIAYRMLGQYDKAVEYLEKGTARYPNHFFCRVNLSACYVLADRRQDAYAEAKEVKRLNPSFSLEQFETTLPFDQLEKDKLIGALEVAGLK